MARSAYCSATRPMQKKLITALDRTNALLARVTAWPPRLTRRPSARGPGARSARRDRATECALADARAKKVDAILADAQVAAGNARDATADLAALRAEVDTSLRKVSA